MFQSSDNAERSVSPMSASKRAARNRRNRGSVRRLARREKERLKYANRKEAGQCTRCESDQLAPDSLMCADCQAYTAAASNSSHARLRADRRKRGVCIRCEAATDRYECLECLTAAGTAPIVTANQTANQTRAPAHHRAPPSPSVWVVEKDGKRRLRYRGQGRRGAPSRLATDEWDLRAIEQEIKRARTDMIAYVSPEVRVLPSIQRAAVKQSALGHLELAQRFLDDLVERTAKGLR